MEPRGQRGQLSPLKQKNFFGFTFILVFENIINPDYDFKQLLAKANLLILKHIFILIVNNMVLNTFLLTTVKSSKSDMDYMLRKFVFGKGFKIIYKLNWQLSKQESVTWPCDRRAVRRLLICLTPSSLSHPYYVLGLRGGGTRHQTSLRSPRSGELQLSRFRREALFNTLQLSVIQLSSWYISIWK